MSIQLSDISKRFGDNLVVNQVTLEIQEGELFVLLGGSGSGKSTLLRLIAGLLQPDTGRIILNERDVTDLPPQARGTGFVFQNYSIFRHMTVAQNVEFGLRIRRVPLAERQGRSDELLELVGLTGLGARYADQLSGGQQQRVALARALAYKPAVLLLDEPFGALDVKIRAQLRQSLKEIQRQLKVTTVLVTHDQEEAFELADHVGVIDHGHLIEIGSPQGLYHHPQTEFVATFIGGGNVLIGREDHGKIRLGSTQLPMPADAPQHDPGAPVRILFRPETIVVQEEPFEPGSGILALGQGEVTEHIFGGSLERIGLAFEGLQGAEPVSPAPRYGQSLTHIEAALPSRAKSVDWPAIGQRLWAGLKEYHVLAPTGLKTLICMDESPAGQAAVEFGLRLAQAASGPATLLMVSNSAEETAEIRERLETLRQTWLPRLPHLETRYRQGNNTLQILLETQEGAYEVVVLGQPRDPAIPRSTGLGRTARTVLVQTRRPVLLVPAPRAKLERILICTAAGEPGKADVRFGGRLARQAGAKAVVLHVRSKNAPPEQRKRVDRHLRQTEATLTSLGLKPEIKVKEGLPVETILRESSQGDYDLIVVGAPSPRAPQEFYWRDLATQVVGGAACPILVIPMVE